MILIVPIDVRTRDGYRATITSFNPSSLDCLVGEVKGDTVRWDLNGTARNNPSSFNLDTRSDELRDLCDYVHSQLLPNAR